MAIKWGECFEIVDLKVKHPIALKMTNQNR
jgi:hypothetical protein